MNVHTIQEELYLMNTSLPISEAKKLAKFIMAQMLRYPNFDPVEIVNVCVTSVHKATPKFDHTRGIMYQYLRNAIKYGLQEYSRKQAKQPEFLTEEVDTTDIDLSSLSDKEVIDLYRKVFYT